MNFILMLIDKIVETHKNVTYLFGFCMLGYLCMETYNIKKELLQQSLFMEQAKEVNIIKQADSIKKHSKYLTIAELVLASKYCEELEMKRPFKNPCDTIYTYLHNNT